MAVAVNVRWDGFTQEQYDAVRALAPLDRDSAPGCLVHIATFDDKGARITDVWEAAEQFQTYLATHLMGAFAQLAIPGQPEVEVLPVHTFETPGLS